MVRHRRPGARRHPGPDPGRRGGSGDPRPGAGKASERHALIDGSDPRTRQLPARDHPPAAARRGVARSTVAPAVLSLILVALVLLSRLLAAAMGLRRGELALASLRGYSRRQLWFLGMLEPLLILVLATPLGVALGYLTPRVLARQWLVPGLPVPFVLASGVAVLGGRAGHRPGGGAGGARRGQRAAQRPDRRRTPSHARRAAPRDRAAGPGRGRGRGARRGREPEPPAGPRRDRPGPADAARRRGRAALWPAGPGCRRAVGPVVVADAARCRRTSPPGPCVAAARAPS